VKVLILGNGISGKASKDFVESRGDKAEIYDGFVDLCVVSPGIKVISELDLAFTGNYKKVIAVTGTNGKTTVVNMLKSVLGDDAVLCGNVGVPATSVAKELENKIAIVEVSSFQLEIPPKYFKPDISIILNITQDHLERHGSMEEYIACKKRICGKINLICDTDPICKTLDMPNTIYFGGATHFEQNTNAVKKVCELLGIQKDIEYIYLPHRIEHVATKGDVDFYDDSKATNIGAVQSAIKTFGGDPRTPKRGGCPLNPTINLILGGIAKGQDFTTLFKDLPSTVKGAFVIGESSDEIISAAKGWGGKIVKCKTLKDAVVKAYKFGKGRRAVLLSPACSSFDMFKNYADRGDKFKAIVNNLID
jgi:UDP-N-acetylmuramoylalanine--D-glutamate ligase